MEQLYFQSLLNDKPTFRVEVLPGQETPDCRESITFTARDKSGNEMEVTLNLTIVQVVEIVKHFFWSATVNSFWCAKVLQRLLVKRWVLCTHNHTKYTDPTYRECVTQLDFELTNDGKRIMRKTA